MSDSSATASEPTNGSSDKVYSSEELSNLSLPKEVDEHEEDFDTFVAKYRGYMRYSYGFSDWRGMVGSTGGVSVSSSRTKK